MKIALFLLVILLQGCATYDKLLNQPLPDTGVPRDADGFPIYKSTTVNSGLTAYERESLYQQRMLRIEIRQQELIRQQEIGRRAYERKQILLQQRHDEAN